MGERRAASADTLLRQVRRTPLPALPAPRVVGVDDWCFRRGRRSGAILVDLVDLERRHVLDLLPDREAATLATWLQAHPSVEIISRDRGASFADGASRGAPQARQVAGRFHVLKNLVEAFLVEAFLVEAFLVEAFLVEAFLVEAFQQVLGREHAALRAAAEAVAGAPLTPTRRLLTEPERHARQTAQARRQARYETARRLRAR